MVKLGEFFLKDRAALFEPTVDLRQDLAQRETFQPFRETGQNAHDDAASLRAGSRLTGPCHLAGHRFGAGLPLATVVASPRKRSEFDASEELRHDRFPRQRQLPVARHPIEDEFWRHLRQDPSPQRDVSGRVVFRHVSCATGFWDDHSVSGPCFPKYFHDIVMAFLGGDFDGRSSCSRAGVQVGTERCVWTAASLVRETRLVIVRSMPTGS